MAWAVTGGGTRAAAPAKGQTARPFCMPLQPPTTPMQCLSTPMCPIHLCPIAFPLVSSPLQIHICIYGVFKARAVSVHAGNWWAVEARWRLGCGGGGGSAGEGAMAATNGYTRGACRSSDPRYPSIHIAST